MSESIRASDDERRVTTELLGQAAAEGRLTLEEHADRVEAALVATHRDQLERLTEDLPGAESAPAVRPGAGPAVLDPGQGPGPGLVRAVSIFGDVRRSGAWLVPARAALRTVFGDVRLDLRQATLEASVTALELSTTFGDVEVVVPAGVVVEVRSRTIIGDVKHKGASAGSPLTPGAPRIVLTGTCLFGDVRVLDEPRWSRLKRWVGRPDQGGTAEPRRLN